MKNKIAIKLILYFTTALFTFSLVIGFLFFFLFTKHTTAIHKNELEKKATRIAQTLSEYVESERSMQRRMGYHAYIRFLDDIAMTDIWIVDRNLELVTAGKGPSFFQYRDLPPDAEKVIAEVFQGSTSFSESFSKMLNMPTLTVGTPILITNGEIIGAVLLHSPIEGISSAVSNGFQTLAISITIALILGILIAIALSIHFTKPLNQMKETAYLLSNGDYTAKTGVEQSDEIGELATVIDTLADRLYLASQESEKLEKLRQDFVSNISHELRTPVTVLRGSLEALCDGVVENPEQVQQYYKQMLSESIHLQRLVNDLLDLSRLQNTDFKIEMYPINLCDIINDVARSMQYIANEKEITIDVNNPLSHYQIIGDYDRIRQMLTIVMNNAIKFSPPGKTVTIHLTHKNKLHLSIIDEGCGIPAHELPYIFDRFHKTQSEENKNGTGLGLAIAKQIANRHGIDIQVISQSHHTEFIFIIG